MRGNVSFFNVFFTHYPGDNVLKMFVSRVILVILSVLRHVCVLCEYIQKNVLEVGRAF